MLKIYKFNSLKTTKVIFDNELSLGELADFIIVDKNVFGFYQHFFHNIPAKNIFILNACEEEKTLTTIENIIPKLLKIRFNRSKTILAIGGGITLDLVAFLSSIYMRGCKLNFVPTTFLAMIDAALGGKTAVNYGYSKNFLGTFYPAEKIFINLDFLKTLSPKEINEGWIEIIKLALLSENGLYELVSRAQKSIDRNLIQMALDIKMRICENDPFDKSERRFLNLGHTFAHVIETISHFSISHGEAVAIGIKAVALFSFRTRWISFDIYEQIISLLRQYGLGNSTKLKPFLKNYDKNILYKDKKTEQKINLIIFDGFHSVRSYPLKKINLVYEILNEICTNEI